MQVVRQESSAFTDVFKHLALTIYFVSHSVLMAGWTPAAEREE